MKFVAFTLTMPGKGSWNGKWTGDDRLYVKVKRILKKDEEKYKHILKENSWFYNWSDGWRACVSTEVVTAKRKNELVKKSDGFCGYLEMIKDIMEYNEIRLGRKGN